MTSMRPLRLCVVAAKPLSACCRGMKVKWMSSIAIENWYQFLDSGSCKLLKQLTIELGLR